MSPTRPPTPTSGWSIGCWQSPHWGEHRARYWLDAARYADTNGIHFDNYREIWAFRDWVIQAFNATCPSIASRSSSWRAICCPRPPCEQQVATGFNRCNITTNEGGVIDEEYLVLYTRDRTETTARVWMGLTAGCAVCHDHKFDPLSQKEFYQMSAFFNNTTQAAMDGNVKDTPPTVFVPAPQDRQRWPALEREIAEVKRRLPAGKKPPAADLQQRLRALEQELAAVRSRGTAAHVMQERGGPPTAYVLFRGEYDKRREAVQAATPAFLPPMPAELPQEPARPGPLAHARPSTR